MILPRSTPSITETFNRLSNPFSEQGVWWWDAEIPPGASLDEESVTVTETRRDHSAADSDIFPGISEDAKDPPGQAWAGRGTNDDTSPTYEPFGDPMEGWAWAPPSEASPADAGLPPLVGARPVPEPWPQPAEVDEPATESWHSFTDSTDAAPKSDGCAINTHEAPPDAPRFITTMVQNQMYNLDTSYDSDSSAHSDVWSVVSSSDDERTQTPDTATNTPYCRSLPQQQQSRPQTAGSQCKPCTTVPKSKPTSSRVTRPSTPSTAQTENAESLQPCPFCTANGENDDLVSDGRKTRKRRRKAVSRTTQRHGRWWQTLGYDGPAYCQRCSEVFRDHIIRRKPNSAQCNRDNPCHECAKVLAHFSSGTGNHARLWEVIDARGYAKVRRRNVSKPTSGVPVTA